MKKWQQIKNSIYKKVSYIQGLVLVLLLLGVIILEFVQVILRYVLNSPLMGIEELLLFPTIWLYTIGNANSALEQNLLSAPVIYSFIKDPKKYKITKIITGLTSFIISCCLAYWAYRYLCYSARVQKLSATLYIPLVYAESFIFISLFLMSIYILIETIDNKNKSLSEYKEIINK